MNVAHGVYIFEFFDCDFDNFLFYIINDIDNYANVCDENESQIDNPVDAKIAVSLEEDRIILCSYQFNAKKINFLFYYIFFLFIVFF